MSLGRLFLLAPGMALLLAAAGAARAQGIIMMESPPPQNGDDAAKATLSPALEKKLKEFIDKARGEQEKSLAEVMEKQIEAMAKVTGLGDDGKKALEAPAHQAVEAGLDDWAAKLDGRMRKQLSSQPAEVAMRELDQEIAQGTGWTSIDWTGDTTLPFERPEWIKAVHDVLTADQAKAWDAAEAARHDAIEKEIADSLKRSTDRIKDAQTQEILAQCGNIETALSLPQDRADKLEALGKSVVDQTSERWRKRVESILLAMEDDQRKGFVRNGNIFIGTNEDESPGRQAAWKDGVAGLLTADETARLKAVADAHRARRAHAMGTAMITILDEKIAFTETQRAQLQPIADRLVKDVPQLFPDDAPNTYYSYSPGLFYGAAAKATDAELKPILDDLQREHWRHLEPPDDPDAPTGGDTSKPVATSEPEDVEKCISSFLYEKTAGQRKLALEANVLKAEDAVRVAGLKPEAAARLQAAARGATEEALANWKWFTEQQIRSQLQEVTPQNVKQRLDSLEDFLFQRNFGGLNRQGPSIWDETVKVELTDPQRDAWKKETDARAAFREKAIAGIVVAEFDRKNEITDEQWTKLEPVITGVVRDYSPEFAQIFSNFNGVPWYMGGGYTLIPFAGVPVADLKTILSKAQYDRWSGSPDCANSLNLWGVVNQIHNQRAQQAKRGNNVRF
jgi:hypothetical protein